MHDFTSDSRDTKTRSMREEVPVGLICVGSLTHCYINKNVLAH